MTRLSWLLVPIALFACDNYAEVREQNTIEAYEAYIAQNPSSTNALEAKSRIETLMYEKAKTEESLEAYDAYLEKYPRGVFHEKARKERETYLWDWAAQTHTPEAWEQYLKEYPKIDARKIRRAKTRLAAAKYAPNIGIGPLTSEPANMAENPEGPKNGWRFKADITNNGPDTLQYLHVTVRFFNDEGQMLGEAAWPLVATQYRVPVEEIKKVPMKPGETRTWDLLTDQVPEGFKPELAKVIPTAVTPKALELSPN